MIEFRLNRNKAAVPLYLQIAGQIEWHILNGLTEHAALLPSTRDLSRQLSVSRGCVIRAYEVLCLKGLCESHVGRGTAICASREGNIASAQRKSERKAEVECIPDSALPGSISLLPSHACTTHLPVTEFRQAFNRVLRYPGRLNQFGLGVMVPTY
ncbi:MULTISPECIES: GntR family transcriptional regulator [Phytobacter]|uniref:HTH gntR-type domain-containing protein n=1 Tax=Phytobacter diazotrophicus TaxID=395631 RepID=A0ABM7VWA9_9ENTR|nr:MULTISPECIES: GntR family transcriptional regulator [Phytobacter]BDD51465.1 hypothetical protein PDTA9734_29520 [Phytobacter diazotrophicus]BEG82494.1 hypothetical protein PDTA9730_29500 [Phytobacter diazotrophicus]BEG88296.1 hypothetical protein PDTA9759_29520 [Phytobacter diazotrophicus]BEG94088.1 hypothetical protein PDTA9832_29470 [Phytobacter diazotrophicus]